MGKGGEGSDYDGGGDVMGKEGGVMEHHHHTCGDYADFLLGRQRQRQRDRRSTTTLYRLHDDNVKDNDQ